MNEGARTETRARQGAYPAVRRLENDFEPLVFRKFPELARAKTILLEAGAELASLSGSGSAVFGLYRDAAKARQSARLLRERADRGQHVFLTRTIARREFRAQFPQRGNRAPAQ